MPSPTIEKADKYIFACVIEGATSDNLKDVKNLYVRTLQKTGTETVYGPAKTFDLSGIITE